MRIENPQPAPIVPSSRDHLIAGYAALAVAVQVLEAGFPSPLPGVKPGLANVITLIVLQRHGWAAAAWVSGLRVLIGSLLVGSFLGPSFWLSAAGGLGAMLALAAGQQLSRYVRLSAIGLSLIAAQAHALAQFGLARLWLIPDAGLDRLLLPLLIAALLFGLVTGLIAQGVLRQMNGLPISPLADKRGR